MLRLLLLLAERLGKRRDGSHNANSHERQGNKGPNDAPAAGRAAISLREDTRIGSIDFAENEIVTLFTLALAFQE
jgi:hypothetical protein